MQSLEGTQYHYSKHRVYSNDQAHTLRIRIRWYKHGDSEE